MRGYSGRMLAGLAALSAVLLLAVAGSAQARESFALAGDYDFAGGFGANGPGMMDIHQATNTLYVVDPSNNRILKFDISDPLNPSPEDFSALGTNEITEADGAPLALGQNANLAIDNSGGPQDGTIYLATNTASDSRAHAYDPDGAFLYTFAHDADGNFMVGGTPQTARAIAVASSGDRAGEIFRLGDASNRMATYLPAPDRGLPPTTAQSVVASFPASYLDSLGAGYSDDGTMIQMATAGFFGGFAYSTLESATLANTAAYIFGGATPFDFKVAPDGTILIRTDASGGSISRYRQTGSSRFFPPPAQTGTVLIDRFGFGHQADGVGMAESDRGYLYATDATNSRLSIFGPEVAPDAEMTETGFVGLTTAELRAEVNALGLTVNSCEFEWGTTMAYENPSVPCDVIPSGNSEMTVTAAVTVTAGTSYHSRVVLEASNSTATYSDDLEWQAPDLPKAITLPVGPIQRQGTAVLGGTVDANKTPTDYFIEYGTDSGLVDPQRYPEGETVPAGSGDNPKRVYQVVTGLDNDTTYYFRVVAETAAGTNEGAIESFTTFTEPSSPQPSTCPNAQFRTGESAGLPGCRAWERVSPAEKTGGIAVQGFTAPRPDGERVFFAGKFGLDDTQSLGIQTGFLADRSADGWQVESTDPGASLPVGDQVGSVWALSSATKNIDWLVGSARHVDLPGIETVRNDAVFLRDVENDRIFPLAVGDRSQTSAFAFGRLLIAANTPTVAFRGKNLPVASGPRHSGNAFYWWNHDGGVQLASIDENGDPVDVLNELYEISSNGEQLLWAAEDGGGIYLTRRDEPTLRITQAEGVSQPAPVSVSNKAWTSDLTYVFFSSAQQFTADSEAGPGDDLYRYDVESETLQDLTPNVPGGAGVQQVLNVSEDGEHAFFIATGQLAPGADAAGSKLYHWDDGTVRLITNNADPDTDVDFDAFIASTTSSYTRFNRVSADGRYFLFAHEGQLGGTAMASIYVSHGHRMLFRYDEVEDRIDCVSCDPTGVKAKADAYLTQPGKYSSTPGNSPLSLATPGHGEPYHMSDDGKVMFATAQTLVPEDTNTAVDTYLWDGDLRLLTSGRSSSHEWAETATEDFRDIYVFSFRQLVPADDDDSQDLYVARVNGGLASQQVRPNPVMPGCEGQSCQGLGEQAPHLPELHSSRPSGEPEVGDQCSRQRTMRQRAARAMRRRLVRFRKARRIAKVSIRRYKRTQGAAARKRAVRSMRVVKRSRKQVKRVAPMHKRSKAAFTRCRGGAQ